MHQLVMTFILYTYKPFTSLEYIRQDMAENDYFDGDLDAVLDVLDNAYADCVDSWKE